MLISTATEKMIAFYRGNLHDISHFLKVYTFARAIGEGEGLDAETQEILDLSAIVHDIACPLCRKKYGNTNGKYQEQESAPLVEEFFRDMPVESEKVQRISWIVSHHHTYGLSEDLAYQILLEADYLVNAEEKGLPRESIQSALTNIFKTETGKRILILAFGLEA